jgi:hypothetical protein
LGRLFAWCDPLVLSQMSRDIRWQSTRMTVDDHNPSGVIGMIFQVILKKIYWAK